MSDVTSDATLGTAGAAQRTQARAPKKAASSTSFGRVSGRVIAIATVALCIGGAVGAFVTWRIARIDPVIASVNGQLITEGELRRRLEEDEGPAVLRQMVAERLKEQFAQLRHLAPTGSQVNARLAEAAGQPGFDKMLQQTGQTTETFKGRLRVAMTEAAVIKGHDVATEAEVRRFYLHNIEPHNPQARYYTPESVLLAAIVTTNVAAAQKALDDLTHGIDFASTAARYSIDRTRANGGLLPVVYRGRSAASGDPSLERTVFTMKIGSLIGPRKIQGHWWLLRCVDRRPSAAVKIEKVHDECRAGVLLVKGLTEHASDIQADFNQFQQRAAIVAYRPRYKSAVEAK